MNNSWFLLLVEDDPVVQRNNKKILERRGYSIKQAYSISQARTILSKESPRAIVLDIKLPDESGGNTTVILSDSGSGLGKTLTLTRGTTKKVLKDVQSTLKEGVDREGLLIQ